MEQLIKELFERIEKNEFHFFNDNETENKKRIMEATCFHNLHIGHLCFMGICSIFAVEKAETEQRLYDTTQCNKVIRRKEGAYRVGRPAGEVVLLCC